ncbi:PREDICTED: Golgi-specific brefeldin A-resistance guanine nucleotide exchange factor 1 [Polistes dominula]|uniref:Golgi-specific brefeldin A-resistance guanine nucleotide exchange factor 1 n=1 Tax=Polistes dominula TaxID=743375 RepID=A0ABM1HWJ8_POLDO|nr:PREDICTED: Golgi-specific brefeldin A-resistance guanine nucleotide exchange factor 1 [Polistes dominula]
MSRILKTACPEGGLHVVEGEVYFLAAAMRRSSHQGNDRDPLMKGLSTLKEALNEANDLSQLEPSVFLAPFLEIIRSEETTGLITSFALSAINKFISYGFVNPDHSTIATCVEAIADAVTHARFVGSDASGDGVVLMRILQVLKALMLSPAGDYLSDESVCEIMLSCFRICFETRLSELLRSTAEHCLRDIVQHLFIRLPLFADDTRVLLSMKKMRTKSMENTRTKHKKNKIHSKPRLKSNVDDIDDETHLLSSVDKVRAEHIATSPITSGANIVDMQGSLDHGTSSDKIEDEKNENKESNNKNDNVKNECAKDEILEEQKQENLLSDTKQKEVCSKIEKIDSGNESQKDEISQVEVKIVEKDDIIHAEVTSEEESNNSFKQNVIESQETRSIDEEKSIDTIQSPVGSVEDLSMDESSINTSKISKTKEPEQIEEYINTQGVRFMPLQQLAPYGALCIRELFRFLVSLCSPLDKQNNEVMTHLGLNLLQVALEIAADALSNFPSLLSLMKDDLCRNLILLLGTDKMSILAANLQLSFLLFESQREHLKFQMEHYILTLTEIVSLDSVGISYGQRELALEAIVRLWRIPGLPAELYVNYDCGLYSTNLYEELIKFFSKNASALMGEMHSMQFISLDAIFMLISGIEIRCKGYKELCKSSRHNYSQNLPTKEELLTRKTNKWWLVIGTEKFNENPRKGIAELTEHGLLGGTLGHPDPDKVANFLKETRGLDKKIIGEYLSKKENKNILNSFVHSFDLRNTRIDQGLRLYLESFRLPGEAPLVFHLVEKFAEHWHESNGKPFASTDAALSLAYGVIMLNVDQHNKNVKKQQTPMTAEDFKKNLRELNGGGAFDQDLLDEIYSSIKGEEIVMPEERTGLVKDNYLWRMVLRRGTGPESLYLKIGNSNEIADKELAEHAWAPIISALCSAYDKAPNKALQRRVAQAFLSCAAISAHYNTSSDLDTLVISLCKFTGLATGSKSCSKEVVIHVGDNGKCQLATRTLFKVMHLHGDALRASWKNIIDCLQALYKARLLPKSLTEGEDFIDPSGKVSLIRESITPKQPTDNRGILSNLYYSYIALDTSRMAEATARKRATEFVANCYLKQIIEESKFLQVESLRSLIGALVSANPDDEDISVFLLELLLEVTIQNRDRVMCIWSIVQARLDGLLTTSARENHPYLLERVTVGMLRLAIRLLRGEEFAYTVLPPLLPLTYLPSSACPPLARQIAYGLFELVKTGAANIHNTEDWKVVFSLLECAGAGVLSPKQTNPVVDEAVNSRASVLDLRPISPVPEWVLVSPTGTEAPLPVAADTIVLDRDLQPHDPAALVKCCESLTFLVRDVAHVTPFNFEMCVRCIRTFAEAVLQCAGKRNRVHSNLEEIPGYQQCPIHLLDLMYTLHTRTAQIFKWWAEESGTTEGVSLWPQAWRPLLQGIARLCCDARRPVRTAAITYLQSTLLAHDLAQLTAIEWSQCLEQVLFPLLAQLLGPIATNDPIGVEETRVRAAMLLSKVFLHHLTSLLTLPGFLPLWLTVLDLLRAYMHADNSELLFEAIPESLKNMLLVMSSANVLAPSSNLWAPTWRAIDGFLPTLKAELFPEPPPPPQPPQMQQVPQVISLIGQQPSFSKNVAPQTELPHLQKENISHISEVKAAASEFEGVPRTGGIPIPISLPPLAFENKETLQVITLVNQPPPSVSSPVAVQPAAQRVFDICQIVPHKVEPSEQQLHPQSELKEEDIDRLSKINQTNEYPTTQKYEKWIQPHSLQQQKCSLEDSCTQPFIYKQNMEYQHMATVNPSHCADTSETTTVDSTATTMFNSAAYFSEDPAADRLFVVTNP